MGNPATKVALQKGRNQRSKKDLKQGENKNDGKEFKGLRRMSIWDECFGGLGTTEMNCRLLKHN